MMLAMSAGLVLERREDHAARRPWPLPHQNQARDLQPALVRPRRELLAAHAAYGRHVVAQERHRMRLQRELQGLIVLDHMFAE